jgi:hypothetical protein
MGLGAYGASFMKLWQNKLRVDLLCCGENPSCGFPLRWAYCVASFLLSNKLFFDECRA